MRERIESADRQAADARTRALECADQRMKEQWMAVALLWEQLANEYREIARAASENQS